jgi:hypothetical protein
MPIPHIGPGQGRESSQLSRLELCAPIEPRPDGCAVPLTVQQRLMLELLGGRAADEKILSVRMCASATRILGPLHVELLRRSIETVVRRHEALRTRFPVVHGTPTQHIDAAGEYALTVVDLVDLPQSEVEQTVKRLAQDFQEQEIDLTAGPLFEARLFKLSAEHHVLIVLIDHMVSDGISNGLLNKEIWLGYDAGVRNEQPSLPPLPVQFADYAVWQQRTHEAWRRDHEPYWKEHLRDARGTRLPTPSALPLAKPAAAVTRHFSFGPLLSERLREVARRERTMHSVVALTTYAVAMSHWCQQEDLLIRCPIHGRQGRPELANLIGFVMNVLYVRMNIRRQDTLLDLLAQAQQEMARALEHRDFDRVLELMPDCRTELEFHWRSAKWAGRNSDPHTSDGIRRRPFLMRVPDGRWKFWVLFNDTLADLCVMVQYWPHWVPSGAVEEFASNLRVVAAALVDRPRVQVCSVLHGAAADIRPP